MKENFTLREVVELTGLSKLVLHAWERRYGTIDPARSDTGRRTYSQADVIRLRLLKTCVDHGIRIGTIATLPTADLEEIVRHHARLDKLAPLLSAIERLDSEEMDRLLNANFITLGPIEFSRDVVLPLMQEVGRRWSEGTLSIAAEHMASAAVRALLSSGFKILPKPRSPIHLLFTTIEGELHETGALIAALVAQSKGLRATYLGPQMPSKAIAKAAIEADAQVICLSGVLKRGKTSQPLIAEIRSILPSDIELWVGGPAYQSLPTIHGVRVFETLQAYESALDGLNSGLSRH